MNSLIGSKALLAQLDKLKSAVGDFAAREQRLSATFRDESAKVKYAAETRDQQRIAASSKHLAEEVDAFENAKEQLRTHFNRQKIWIGRALTQATEKALAEITAQDDECKQQAQDGLTKAEQDRDAALAREAADWDKFQQRWAEFSGAFLELEQSLRSAFGGYGTFRRRLNDDKTPPDFPGNREATVAEFQRVTAKLQTDLNRFKSLPLPLVFRFAPVWLLGLLLLGTAAAPTVLQHFGVHALTPAYTIAGAVGLVLVVAAYVFGGQSAGPLARIMAEDFLRARRLLAEGWEKGAAEHEATGQRIDQEFKDAKHEVNQTWKRASKEIINRRGERELELEQRAVKLHEKNEESLRVKVVQLQQKHQEILTDLRRDNEAEVQQLTEARNRGLAEWEHNFQKNWEELAVEWQQQVLPLYDPIRAVTEAAETLFPSWSAPAWNDWTPPATFLNAAQYGKLEIELEKFTGGLPKDPRLTLPCPPKLALPLLLIHPQQGSLLFETGKDGGATAVGAINHLLLQLLATTPPGRLEFTIFDPVGMGQNFAALMHLADYQASTINSRIWTQTAHFEEKLAELSAHMEKIIQMYLRNEYATIADYNAEAGSVAEKYHFLVIASFPVNFSETAARRLRNIAANGARCGVFTLIQWDQRSAPPQDFVPDELRQQSVCLTHAEKEFEFAGWHAAGIQVMLAKPPEPEFTTQLLHRIGDAGKNSNRVEVPFQQIAPAEPELWANETSEELRVPIGRSGATKWQYLAMGRDTRQHALIAGKTGSGKSTLFHIIITNLALRCSPEQVEFYLVDFKKGVEFKCYGNHRLPHAKVVAIESDRAFGLSVLQRVDEELRRRGDLFRQAGAQDLPGYKRNGGTEAVPRTLLMIDEFQEFFVEEDRVSQNAAVLLDRIVRQGRAFGIHVLLGSQTLGGAYTLARATIGQMAIRIALQCNEADAYLIMDQDNPAPRLLSRPGEGIYNDTSGSIEGNSPFQAVWLPDRTRENYLAQIRARADQSGRHYPGPIVFEGNAPANVRENQALKALLNRGTPALSSRIWLGAPNAIKEPTAAIFRPQSAANLLVVGQSDERALTIVSVGLVALAAQHRADGAQFFVLHNLPDGSQQSDFFQRIIQPMERAVTQAGNGTLAKVMGALSAELKRRQESETAVPEIFVVIHELQNFKKLRAEDEFSFSSTPTEATPAATLQELINEGPAHGIHLIITCDSYSNVNRYISRKALGEIEMRVVFQMSASDSASLIDAPDAATLGLHRAILFNDREGTLETFRPYALPGNDWVEEVGRQGQTAG